MANPNKTVAAFRNATLVMQVQEVFRDKREAEKRRSELRQNGEYKRVSMHAFRVGPKSEMQYNYAVRAYV